MNEYKQISANTEAELWQQLTHDLGQDENQLQYRAMLNQGRCTVLLDIDIDLGGGFESGFATTILSASFPNPIGFSFAVHPQHFTDIVGKLFGMQDVVIGYPDFDEKLVVKATDEDRVKTLLADASIRETLLQLPDFTLEVELPDPDDDQNEAVLELFVEEGITDPARLQPLYRAFTQVLNQFCP